MNRIIKFVMLDIIKNKIVLSYAVLLAAFSWAVFSLESQIVIQKSTFTKSQFTNSLILKG